MKRTFEQEIQPTPQELAEAWWSMDATDQAEFFNHLGIITKDKPFLMQLQYVQESSNLSLDGSMVMKLIGDYH